MEPDNEARMQCPCITKFQSTGSVWSPTYFCYCHLDILKISIHGLRVEPDVLKPLDVPLQFVISIHGLRVEPDVKCGSAID